MTSYFAANCLAPRLPRFWQTPPGFDLQYFHTNDLADFTDRKLHVAVQWLHLSEVGRAARLLVEGNLMPACNPALLQDPVAVQTPADLVHHSLLQSDDGSAWKEWLSKAGVPDLKPRYYEFYEDTNVRQKAAVEGEGFALVCPGLSAEDIAAGRLVCPFDIKLDTFSFYLVVPHSRLENTNVRKLVNWLIKESTGPYSANLSGRRSPGIRPTRTHPSGRSLSSAHDRRS